MYDKRDDIEQAEWCSEWSRKHKARKEKRLRHWRICKTLCVAVLYEFVSIVKGE